MKLTRITVRLPHRAGDDVGAIVEDANTILTAHLAHMGAFDAGMSAVLQDEEGFIGLMREAVLPNCVQSSNRVYITHVPRERRELPLSDWTPA